QWAVEQAIDNYQRAQTLLASDDARLPGIPKILKELNSLLRDLKYGLGPAGSTSKPEEEKDNAEEADDYAVLGVDPSASLREMTVAKRRLLLQYHPDKAPDRKNAEDMQRREDMSKRINLAVKRLGI
ncbi:MAG TPA: DnaJ domain-containing protein, partial [Steroidobacteraceae bacterium]|nr:DnaJ domain-containing protein [Steroidobacteraceae bacterium]